MNQQMVQLLWAYIISQPLFGSQYPFEFSCWLNLSFSPDVIVIIT